MSGNMNIFTNIGAKKAQFYISLSSNYIAYQDMFVTLQQS